MRISDWSSDVCSSDLRGRALVHPHPAHVGQVVRPGLPGRGAAAHADGPRRRAGGSGGGGGVPVPAGGQLHHRRGGRGGWWLPALRLLVEPSHARLPRSPPAGAVLVSRAPLLVMQPSIVVGGRPGELPAEFRPRPTLPTGK